MAFTVEDGTGEVAGANSYNELAFITSYLTDRGRQTAWAALSESQQQQIAISVTDYMDKRFGRAIRGEKLLADQPLEFPRRYAYTPRGDAIEGVPEAWKKAHAEYCDRARTVTLMPDPPAAVNSSGEAVGVGQLLQHTESVDGVVSESKTFAKVDGVSAFTLPRFPAADLLIRDLLNVGGGPIR